MSSSPPSLVVPADLDANQSALILWTAGSVIAVAIVSVSLRFISRIATKVPLLLDDWLILATLPLSIATSSISIWGCVYHHFGTHVLATGTIDSIHNFLRGLYVFELTYAWSIAGAKFSMMAIYWRILPSPHIRWPLRITAATMGAWLVATTLVPIFSCNPIQGFWMFEIQKTCIDSLKFYIASAAANIAIDIAMLLIPIILVARLQISMSQKIAVCAIFGLGIFVTACSAMRLYQLVLASNEGLYSDPTWNLIGSALWSDIETNASIVCACLPTMRPLLRLVLHGSLKSRAQNSTSSRHTRTGTPTLGMPRQGRYQRFSDDRPLSGVQGDGEWLGKGVGAPGYGHGLIVNTEIEMRKSPSNSPISPLRTPPPVYGNHNDRISAMSTQPPIPPRSPLRRNNTVTEAPSQYDSILETYSRESIFAHSYHHHSISAPPVPSMPPAAYAETPVWGRSRRASNEGRRRDEESGSDDDVEIAPARTRTLMRDPYTNKYILAPRAYDANEPEDLHARSMSPWERGWENELDQSIEGMWDRSRAASRRPSNTSSIYEWSERSSQLPVPVPPMTPRPEWERVHIGGGRTKWQTKSTFGRAEVMNLDAKNRGGWI